MNMLEQILNKMRGQTQRTGVMMRTVKGMEYLDTDKRLNKSL